MIALTALFLGLPTFYCIDLYTLKELLSALRVLDVLDAKIYTLLHVAVADNLMHDDTNSRRGNIVDNTGTT